jgi:hypothetical protein
VEASGKKVDAHLAQFGPTYERGPIVEVAPSRVKRGG